MHLSLFSELKKKPIGSSALHGKPAFPPLTWS
uniref:Uncharacterized protein n=1 Tax=Anguilla anguilla TaxID=7936 RepID=A0A0E9QYQ8_ANGAN